MNDMRQRLLEMERKNLIGKLITLIQLLVSVICIVTVAGSGMLPKKYLIFLIGALAVLFGATHILQYPKNKVLRYTGMIISLLMTIILAAISMGMMKTDDVLKKVGGATYKTDNMVVVVKKGDSAKNIEDAEDYRFGYQTAVDQKNTDKMIKDIEKKVGKDVKTEEYESLTDEANALLNGNVDAAVFNEGYMSMIDESVEGFSEKVKILYQYGIKTKVKSEKKADVTEPFNVFISGIDVAGPITTNSRSDVNIIAVVNPQTHQILLVTTPRDYYVPIPGISGGQRDKLTHAGIYGIDASMRTLGELYETDINYYARLNFTSMIDIVDTLGGIDVYSEYEFTTSEDSEHVMDVQKGYNHFNGEEALAFCRERHNVPGGDNQRGKDQQAVITAILKKCLSPTMLLKANAIMEQVSKDIETNMSQEEINALIKYQLSNNPAWTIQSVAAEGTNTTGTCYSSGDTELFIMEPVESSVQNIINLANIVEEGGVLTEGEQLN